MQQEAIEVAPAASSVVPEVTDAPAAADQLTSNPSQEMTSTEPNQDAHGSSLIDIPDYMTAELNAADEQNAGEAPTGNAEPPASDKKNKDSAEADSFEVTVHGVTYVADAGSLFRKITNNKDETILVFVSSLIVVVAEARDNASSSWGKFVKFTDRDNVVKHMYLRNSEIITNGKAIVKIMSEEGLHISCDNRMIDSLLHYLNMAQPLEDKKAICSDRIGWHENVYLSHDNSIIGKSDERFVYTGAPIANHHAVKGTWQEWKENVGALCQGNSLMILAVCVAFASVMLRLLKVESGGFHIFGESSTGKSTSLYVAASIYGEPKSLMGTWRTTANGAEGRAKQCNDSLMILDELHQSTPKEAGSASYMLFNGKGKVRSNVLGEAREVAEWQLNCLSSGEIAYSAFIQENGKGSRAGQEVRMLDISADMGVDLGAFENIHGAKDSNTFAEQLKKASSDYYGTPAREFIHNLIGRIDHLDKQFAGIKARFFKDFVPAESSGQVQRVATKMVLAAMAGEMATADGLTGWEANEAYKSVGGTFKRWLSSRGTTGQQEAEKAVEQVKTFLLRHGLSSRFIPVVERPAGGYKLEFPERQSSNSNMAGFRITTSDVYEFIVFTDVYKAEMCQGLNCQYVTKTLANRGYLKVTDDGPQVRHRLPGMDLVRVYHFTSAILSDTDEFEPAGSETEE